MAEDGEGISAVIAETAKISPAEVMDAVQRAANPLIQDRIKVRRGKIEGDLKATIPAELFEKAKAGEKYSDVLQNFTTGIGTKSEKPE